MKQAYVALFALAAPMVVASPINKVVSMISDLQAQIIAEGGVAKTQYANLVEMCEDRARNLGFEIKTGTSEAENLKAAIAQDVATLSALRTKVDELAGALATNDADLTAATHIRNKEAADFAAEEK